jgi:hypothetical protein
MSQGRAHRRTWLTVHVATSVALVGTSAELLVTAVRAATRSDPYDAHSLYALMQLLIFSLGVPTSFVALGTGLRLVAISRWKLLRDLWVTGKLLLLAGTILVGSIATGPMSATLVRTSAGGHLGGSDRWLLAAAIGAQATMVVTATALAIFKPSRRRRALVATSTPPLGGR